MLRPLKVWMIVGGRRPEEGLLRPEDYVGDYKSLPRAQNFKVGQWLDWRWAPSKSEFCVCVEVSL